MRISPGGRIGPYEVVARIGAGGMGEVWRARDVRLDREVAIKVLPAELASDAQFRVRFEREAKAVAQLAHPNICSLFDIGDGYFVMELLDGETLAARIARGPLSVREAAQIGAQIADALDQAHRRGIVHRDLKPENVMLTRGGAKLLDFGLAWNVESTALRRRLTESGMVVGTMQYMAPEQVQAGPVDHRADIFALGAVLYEAVTGRAAFEGSSAASILAAIIGSEPVPVAERRPETPAALEHVIVRCLRKAPDDRWQSAHDVAEELRWIAQGSGSGSRALTPRAWKRSAAIAMLVTLVLVAVGSVVFLMAKLRSRTELPKLAMTIEIPPDVDVRNFNISFDAQTIGILGIWKGDPHIWVRQLGTFEFERIPGTVGAQSFVFSPNAQSLAFIARGRLWVLRLGEHEARAICAVSPTWGWPQWTLENTIVFDQALAGPLMAVEARPGAVPRPITVLGAEEAHHFDPEIFHDGELLFFSVSMNNNRDPRNGLYVQRRGEREKHFVVASPPDAYSPVADWLVTLNGDATKVVYRRFDRRRLKLEDEERTLSAGRTLGAWLLAPNGMLFTGDPLSPRTLSLIDRAGTPRVLGDIYAYAPRLSPDGKQVAYEGSGEASGIWVVDLARGTRVKVTECRDATRPVWSSDGRRVVYGCAGKSGLDVYIRNADGTGLEELLVSTVLHDTPSDVSSDGKMLVFSSGNPERGRDLLLLPLVPGSKPQPLIATPANERLAEFSPDGELLAYTSDESGRVEVYIRPVEAGGRRVQVSVEGGTEPRWRKDGRELFILLPFGKLASVEVRRSDGGVEVGVPRPLIDVNVDYPPTYDISGDGQTFVVAEGDVRRMRRIFMTTNMLPRE